MLNDAEKVIEYKALINVKNEMIAKLEKRSKDWEQAKYDADDKIVELKKKLKYSIDASLYNSVVDRKIEKIAELNEICRNYRKEGVAFEIEIAKLENYIESLADEQSEEIKKMWRLQEHIDCLENNPFRRGYNWVVSIVKYRVKLVKIGDNK